jgi:phosphoglucosamine mutase
MSDKLFGTTGVRKVYGDDFNLDMALRLGKTLGTYIQRGTVAIARDVRTTSKMIEDALVAGILSTGVSVVRVGMVPTPTLAFITKHRAFETGLMVTASHNPPEYTGVKFWDNEGMGYTPDREAKLEEIYQGGEFSLAPWDRLGSERELETAVKEHIDSLLSQCDADLIRSRQFSVVVDPGNGAASVLTPYLVQKLACKVISINSQPDGHFPGRRSEPDEKSLVDTIKVVQEAGADLGVAHDGDADRVVFVTESGEVIRGDRIIALLAGEILSSSENRTIVTTVDSSLVLDETVEKAGGKTLRTPVGDIRVAMEMRNSSASFGGEACGVFIYSDYLHAPEPFLTACKILELMAKTGKSFGSLISDIPVYPLRKAKLECPNSKKKEVMEALANNLPEALTGSVDILTVDGLGITLKEGWVLVRPSGTEPVIRITCEAQSSASVERILDEARKVVENTIESFGS